jgi:hypothetical protein|tara:strand:+ start:136 stop:330 length:195 start_codon:yes stop_codon:yes gene_type:complete
MVGARVRVSAGVRVGFRVRVRVRIRVGVRGRRRVHLQLSPRSRLSPAAQHGLLLLTPLRRRLLL